MGELSIKVTIGDRSYLLTIQADEEEKIRKAAKLIEKNIKDLEQNYAVRDKQDLLAMTALQYASEVMSGTINTTADDEVITKLDAVIDTLDKHLR